MATGTSPGVIVDAIVNVADVAWASKLSPSIVNVI
jgi:hypothetical protein